ncbi:MAG: ATP-binding protein [Actinomycetia bacterium]|nr:ATP-binding protein [Actinomycetes bacterium]MCL2729295.1 ATP-binding protein [Actinomycetes bacterium]
MTAESYDAESGPPGRALGSVTRLPVAEPPVAEQPAVARAADRVPTAHDALLETFLLGQPQVWGGPPAGVGENGFAALRFDATPSSVTRTRSFLRSTLTGWQLPDLVDDATAIAAELVANAVTHALRPAAAPPLPPEPSAWIALLRTDHAVVCAVADPSPDLPAMAEPEPFAESGRGLHIVAELSETWGHSRAETAGKTVWARLASAR